MLTIDHDTTQRRNVSVILTVKNDAEGCAQTLDSLVQQIRPPDEVVVVDGGSTDSTRTVIDSYSSKFRKLVVVDAPGANIARGREIATGKAQNPIIASIDAGCRAEPNWLDRLTLPFDEDINVDVVAGMYSVEANSLFEEVVGLATMRGQLEPVNPDTFNPSGRSLAYTRDIWQRAGGWPTWLHYSEDTLFDLRLRRVAHGWRFAGDAIVHWRPRTGFSRLARQFYFYGTGRGHTQIGAEDFAYNIRNLLMLLIATVASLISPWCLILSAVLFAYFYVWTFHEKATRIAIRTKRWAAYPLTMLVMWTVLFSNLAGYVVGSRQRSRDRTRYGIQTERYLTA